MTHRSLSISLGRKFLAVLLGTSAVTAAQATDYVYVGANNPSANQNAVLGYRVGSDGALSPVQGSPFKTGGTGYFDSSYKLGPFDNDQELAVAADQNTLYAVNSGSNTIAGFAVAPDGTLHMQPFWPVSSRGDTPVSIGVSPQGLTIVNNASNPARASGLGSPDISSIGLAFGHIPFELPGSTLALPQGAYPSQALTIAHDPYFYSTTFPTPGTLNVYRHNERGQIESVQTVTPPIVAGTQSAPLGLWSSPTSSYLYVGLTNVNKLAIYHKNHGRLHYVGMVDNSGQALCWIRGTRDGHFLLTANTADNSLSVYDLSNPAVPREIQHVQAGGNGGLEQFDLDRTERHIFVLQAQNGLASAGHSNRIVTFVFDPRTGALGAQPSTAIQLPLDGKIRPSGLIVVHRAARDFGPPPSFGLHPGKPDFLGL